MSQQRIERNQFKDIGRSERKDIRRRSVCAWISQHKLHHTHVSLFLHRTESVFCSENSHLNESSNGSSAFFGLRTLTVKVKNVRSSGWSVVHERINAVPSVLLASRRNRNQKRGRDNERVAAPMACHCVPSIFTCPISVCTSKVGAWKRNWQPVLLAHSIRREHRFIPSDTFL